MDRVVNSAQRAPAVPLPTGLHLSGNLAGRGSAPLARALLPPELQGTRERPDRDELTTVTLLLGLVMWRTPARPVVPDQRAPG